MVTSASLGCQGKLEWLGLFRSGAGGVVDSQLRLALPEPLSVHDGALRIWLLATEPGQTLPDRRLLLVDALRAGLPGLPGDLALVRVGRSRYVVFAPEALPPTSKRSLVEHLERLFQAPELIAQRSSSLKSVLGICLKPGRSRGTLAQAEEGVRSRTDFEHTLLQVAARHDDSKFADALRASARAERALDGAVHPAIHAMFRRERGDMLAEMFEKTGDLRFAEEAAPAFSQAAIEFERLGLVHQRRAADGRAETTRQLVQQPWIPGFPRTPSAPPALGYSVHRLCGFEITLAAPETFWTHVSSPGALVPLCELQLADSDVLALMAGAPSSHRRVAATVGTFAGGVVINTGLVDELPALLGHPSDSQLQDGVTAISVECGTLRFAAQPFVFRPNAPVTFRADPLTPAAHRITVNVAMERGDDHRLAFTWRPPHHHATTFL